MNACLPSAPPRDHRPLSPESRFGRGAVHNPFSSERVKPGALPYLLPAGHSLASLLDQLLASRGLGQIVGPHGAGKSTLLASLNGAALRRGIAATYCEAGDPGA